MAVGETSPTIAEMLLLLHMSVVGLQQPTFQVIGSPCQLVVFYWSLSVVKTDEEQRHTLIWAITFQLMKGSKGSRTNFSDIQKMPRTILILKYTPDSYLIYGPKKDLIALWHENRARGI